MSSGILELNPSRVVSEWISPTGGQFTVQQSLALQKSLGEIIKCLRLGYGNLWIKDNSTPTPITNQFERYLIEGTSEPSELNWNFSFQQEGNVLMYMNSPCVFHANSTFSMTGGNNDRIGIYLCVNRDPQSALNPSEDRLSESEVYITMPSAARPIAATVQALVELSAGDRLYTVVQNITSTNDITVNFLNTVVVRA